MQCSPGLLRSSRNERRDRAAQIWPVSPQARAQRRSRLQKTDRWTGARLRVQEASPGADGSEIFRSLPEGVLCCLEVTRERVAGRGTDGHRDVLGEARTQQGGALTAWRTLVSAGKLGTLPRLLRRR